MPSPSWLAALLFVVAAAAAACSGEGGGGDAPDADAGTELDAGTEPDAGEPLDAGTPDPCDQGEPAPEPKTLPADVRAAAPDLEVRGASRRLEVLVRATSRLTSEQVEEFRARSCAAFAFDLEALGLRADAPEIAATVRVVVLDTRSYNAATGAPGTYGVTFGAWDGDGDAFVVPESALAAPEDLDDTLAHELTHLLQGRWAPNDALQPWYFIEGQAINLGAQFARSRYGRAVSFVNGWIANATGADATTTFTRYGVEDKTDNLSEVGHDQSMSGFFVEYLRVVHPRADGTKGYPDALSRLFGTLQVTSGGATLSAAFLRTWDGLTLSAAKQAFVDWLNATDADRAGRLAGTVWE